MRLKYLSLVLLSLMLASVLFNVTSVYGGYRVTVERSVRWVENNWWASADCVAVGDVDGDGVEEIVTAGDTYDGIRGVGQLRIWSWSGITLTLEKTQEWYYPPNGWTYVYAVAIADVDDDGVKEILTGGNTYDGTRTNGQLRIWSWDGATLTLEKSQEWYYTPYTWGWAHVQAVAVADVDDDGVEEIVTGGYTYDGTRSNGQLRIWSWDETTLTLEKSQEWYYTPYTWGYTYVYGVAIADVDDDGVKEILTGGNTYDGTRDNGQLRIWSWDGTTTLTLEKTKEWYYTPYKWGDTYVEGVAIADVDNDGTSEIITVGSIYDGNYYSGQLRIWSWAPPTLTLENSREWRATNITYEEYPYDVAIDDVDLDGVKEIITVGYSYDVLYYYYGSLDIWSWVNGNLELEKQKQYVTTYDTEFYGVATGDIDKDGIKEIVACGYDDDGYSNAYLTILGVVSIPTTISVSINPTTVTIGNSLTISGKVANQSDAAPIPGASVTLEYSTGAGYTLITTSTTDANGNYASTWAPPATGSYTIRASWSGDEEHAGASNTASLSVAKRSSLIAVTIPTRTVNVGDTITASGMLYPALATTITMNYTKPDGTYTAKNVASTSAGAFSDTLTPTQAGTWTIKATWAGDAEHLGATSSVTVAVTKQDSAIDLTVSPLTTVGEDATVQGAVTPGLSTTITLKYTKPDGTSTTKTVNSNATGWFTDTLTPDQAGTWTITASWAGNDNYNGATSAMKTTEAKAVEPPTLATASLGIGVVALIIALIAMYLIMRKKGT